MRPKFLEFLANLRKVANYDPEQAQYDNLVTRSEQVEWIGEDITHNPGRIGLLLDIPAKTMALGLQEIPAGGSSDMQRHHHESVHCVLEGEGYSEIGPSTVRWRAGDFIYTPVWMWHRHYNAGLTIVRMILVENSPLLDGLALGRRESAGLVTYAELQSQNAA